MKNYFYILSFLTITIFSACTGNKNETKTDKKTKETTTQAEPGRVHQLMMPLLQKSQKVEFQFYNEGISSETGNRNQIANFFYFVSPEPATNYKCDYTGAVVFKDIEDILFTIDFAIKGKCTFAKVTVNGETFYQKFSAEGLKFLSNLANLGQTQTAPQFPPQGGN